MSGFGKIVVGSGIIQNNPYSGIVANYSMLPTPASSFDGQVFLVTSSQGTAWLPGSLGGTYYAKGYYVSYLGSWQYVGETPYQATQADVDAGVIADQFVSPLTLANSQRLDYLQVKAKNTTGSAQTVGKVAYITGSQGSLATFGIADKDSEATSSKTFGLLSTNVNDNAAIPIITKGKYKFNGLDTSALTEGGALWLGDDGNLTQTKPVTPAHAVFIGWLEIKGNNSTIIVDIQNGYELEELHNVLITTPQDGEILQREDGLWKNKPDNSIINALIFG